MCRLRIDRVQWLVHEQWPQCKRKTDMNVAGTSFGCTVRRTRQKVAMFLSREKAGWCCLSGLGLDWEGCHLQFTDITHGRSRTPHHSISNISVSKLYCQNVRAKSKATTKTGHACVVRGVRSVVAGPNSQARWFHTEAAFPDCTISIARRSFRYWKIPAFQARIRWNRSPTRAAHDT